MPKRTKRAIHNNMSKKKTAPINEDIQYKLFSFNDDNDKEVIETQAKEPEQTIRVIELFAGVGGFRCGLNKVELIKCGNGKRIDAEREQWSDGVNLLCIRPGVVIAYDRNFVTNQTLRRHGIKVIEIPSSELSRGRGGSHCMSMALVREED